MVTVVALAAIVVALGVTACAGTGAHATAAGGAGTGGALAGQVYQVGKASWYGARFNGRPTASGEPFDEDELTAAHRTLRFGTLVRVTNRVNGRSVVVRINDRGPHRRGLVIDVSEAAAKRLDMIEAGVVPCQLEIVRPAR
jgi:rare lipoprotein A